MITTKNDLDGPNLNIELELTWRIVVTDINIRVKHEILIWKSENSCIYLYLTVIRIAYSLDVETYVQNTAWYILNWVSLS